MKRVLLSMSALLGSAVVVLGAGGCDGDVKLVDPCATVVGTCVTLHVDPSPAVTRVDRVDVDVRGGGFTFHGVSSPADGQPVDLPVAVALVFSDLGGPSADLVLSSAHDCQVIFVIGLGSS